MSDSNEESHDVEDETKIKGLNTAKEGMESDYWDKLPRGYLSISQVEQFLKCGEAYRQRYILGKTTTSNNYMVQGRCVHFAAEQLNLNLIKKKEDEEPLGNEEIIQHYVDYHEKELKGDQELELVEMPSWDAVKDEGVGLTRMYRLGALGQIKDGKTGEPLVPLKPVAAEQSIRVTLSPEDSDPIPFVGIVDIVEDGSLADIKVKNKQAPQNEADNSIQLTIYAHVLGKPVVSLEQLVKKSKTKPARYVRSTSYRDSREAAHAVSIIGDVAVNIAEGRFPRTHPGNWWCSQKWCKFWDDCRGRKF